MFWTFLSRQQSSGRSNTVRLLEWVCSVLYYSCSRTQTHDPATHLALIPMQPAVSEDLIKLCKASGPSSFNDLNSTSVLLQEKKTQKTPHNICEIFRVTFTLRVFTSKRLEALHPSKCHADAVASVGVEKKNKWRGALISIKFNYIHIRQVKKKKNLLFYVTLLNTSFWVNQAGIYFWVTFQSNANLLSYSDFILTQIVFFFPLAIWVKITQKKVDRSLLGWKQPNFGYF